MVTETPKALKKAIEKQMLIERMMRILLVS